MNLQLKTACRFASLAAVFTAGCVPLPSMRTIASELNGIVVDANGGGESGVHLHRHVYYHWTNETHDDDATTDAHGRFRFAAIRKGSVVAIAHQPVVDEELTTQIDGHSVVLWKITKMDYDNAGENRGRPFSLRCEFAGTQTTCALFDRSSGDEDDTKHLVVRNPCAGRVLAQSAATIGCSCGRLKMITNLLQDED